MALRWVAGLVLLCVLLQALLIPAQRINERTHFHVSSSRVWTAPKPSQSQSQSVARAVFSHRAWVQDDAHGKTVPHRHDELLDHDHGARADVVYVRDHDTSSDKQHAPAVKRLVLDQDGLWAAMLPALIITVARVGHIKSTLPGSTRSELPLERPPRL